MPDTNPIDRARWIMEALQTHEGPLVRYACRLTGDLERARDVVQDVFAKLWKESPERLDGRLAEWLYAVCRNRAIDVRRKERRMRTLDISTDVSMTSPSPGPAEQVEVRQTASRAAALLTDLPDNQQEVVRLRFQSGLSYKEISAVTGLTVTNVGYLIHTAIAALRAKLA